MHIMYVIDSLSVGGAERALVETANSAASDGHRASVCVTRTNCDLASDLQPDIELFVLGRRKRFDWPAMRRFADMVGGQHIDVFHAYGRSSLSFLAFLKTVGSIAPSIPIVLNDQFGIELDSSIPLWLRFWGRRWVTHYVGVYPRLGEWAKAAGIPDERISTIDNALSPSRIQKAAPVDLRQEFDLRGDELVGMVVGGLREEKGTDVLLDSLDTISQELRRSSVRILIVGGDRHKAYAEDCRDKCVQLGLRDIVDFVGERSDVPGLLRSVDFALLPSRSEGSPHALIEYMFAGLPFVATKVGGIAPRLVESGVPEFVPPDDVHSLAEALERLVSLSPSERRDRGRFGQEIALHYFDIRQVMPRWYAVYKTAIESAQK